MNIHIDKTRRLQVFIAAILVACGSCTSVKSESDEKVNKLVDSLAAVTDAIKSCGMSESVLAVRDALLSLQGAPQCTASNEQNLAEMLGQFNVLLQALLERMKTLPSADKAELESRRTLIQVTKDYATLLNYTKQAFDAKLDHLEETNRVQLFLTQDNLDTKLEKAIQGSASHLNQAKQFCRAHIAEQKTQIQGEIAQLDRATQAAQQKFRDELDTVKSQVSVLQQSVSRQEQAMDGLKGTLQQLRLQLQETSKRKDCPSPFMKIYGDCLYIHRESKKTWTDARAFCSKLGGDLAVPSDAVLLRQFLIDFAGRATYWLGGSDTETEGTWKYVNGKSVPLHTGWRIGQPDNYKNNEDCLSYYQPQDMYLNDLTCHTSQYFVCQTYSYV